MTRRYRHSGFPNGVKANLQASVLRRGADDREQAVRVELGAVVADCITGSRQNSRSRPHGCGQPLVRERMFVGAAFGSTSVCSSGAV